MHHLPAHVYLDKLGIQYEKAEFPVSTEKGAAQVTRALGYRERQMIKTLIFKMDGGDQSIVSGNLKKVAGSRDIHLASPEVVKQKTGYIIGSIPPFSWQPEGLRAFLDIWLMSEPLLAVGTGLWGNEILITPENLVKASRSRVVNLVDREKPALLE